MVLLVQLMEVSQTLLFLDPEQGKLNVCWGSLVHEHGWGQAGHGRGLRALGEAMAAVVCGALGIAICTEGLTTLLIPNHSPTGKETPVLRY